MPDGELPAGEVALELEVGDLHPRRIARLVDRVQGAGQGRGTRPGRGRCRSPASSASRPWRRPGRSRSRSGRGCRVRSPNGPEPPPVPAGTQPELSRAERAFVELERRVVGLAPEADRDPAAVRQPVGARDERPARGQDGAVHREADRPGERGVEIGRVLGPRADRGGARRARRLAAWSASADDGSAGLGRASAPVRDRRTLGSTAGPTLGSALGARLGAWLGGPQRGRRRRRRAEAAAGQRRAVQRPGAGRAGRSRPSVGARASPGKPSRRR